MNIVNVNYRGDLVELNTQLVECSDCRSVVPWDSFQAHIAWHARIVYAPLAVQAAAELREQG